MHGFLFIFNLELIEIIHSQIKSEMHSKIFAICLSSAVINLIYHFCDIIKLGHKIHSSYNRSPYAI